MNTMPPLAEMERARHARDAAYNGVFFIAVRTTGIFCRPTCPARSPLPRNVEYFATAREALFAGYRPCKRCRPLDAADQPAWAAKLIAEVERDPSARITEGGLRTRGVDPGTVRRYFLKQYGMTFQAYTRARRLTGAFTRIREGKAVDQAVLDSGYESPSGFREAFTRAFGASPSASRQRDCVRLTWLDSPLGPLVAGATDEGVCLLEFSDRRMIETQLETVRRLFKTPVVPGNNEHLERLKQELADYFAGSLEKFTMPLIYPGSPFQRRVWDQLLRIPYGETRSYYDIAVAVGSPKAVRAVGRANGLNRIAIVIPCHRVVNKDGALGGYGGGLRRKEFLLGLERRNDAFPARRISGTMPADSPSEVLVVFPEPADDPWEPIVRDPSPRPALLKRIEEVNRLLKYS
jgi:AraC family transcriptional regulator of adaptative response/methylated-DNA-[protein]-cysteine methyltransferase